MSLVPQSTYGISKRRLSSPQQTELQSSNITSTQFETPRLRTAIVTSHDTDDHTTSLGRVGSVISSTEHLPKATQTPARPGPGEPAFHRNIYAEHAVQTPLPPVSPSRRLSSSPYFQQGQFPATWLQTPPNPQQTPHRTMNPLQMQTPPPTRGHPSSKQSRIGATYVPGSATTPVNSATLAAPTSVDLRAMPPPETLSIQTPIHYSNTQFSPEMFQFPSGHPQSAPVYPQSRLFWDPQTPTNHAGATFSTPIHDPFAASPQAPNNFMWTSPSQILPPPPPPNFGETPALSLQGAMSQGQWLQDDLMIGQNAFSQASVVNSDTTSIVDPNLLLDLNVSATEPMQTVQPNHTLSARQPYEHQMQESRRELESARKAKQRHSRSSTSSSAGQDVADTRANPHRGHVEFGAVQRDRVPKEARLSAASLEAALQRKPSPLKRLSQLSQGSLTAIPETLKPRARTRLVIGDDGRARTETLPADEDDKCRRSGLWADLDSDSDSDDDIIPSQRSSFILPSDSNRKSKHIRLESTLDSGRFERTASSGSLHNLTTGLRRSASASSRKAHKLDTRRYSTTSFGASSITSDSAQLGGAMDGVEITDAQTALRKVVEERLRRKEQSAPETMLRAHNQRWSMAAADVAALQNYKSDESGFPLGIPRNNHIAQLPSPTTRESSYTTPSTTRTDMSMGSIRCVCNNPGEDGSPMLCCESCRNWLHTKCVHSNAQQLPPVYVCVFCTGNTPIARGGRIREPLRSQHHNFASPLANRSNNFGL